MENDAIKKIFKRIRTELQKYAVSLLYQWATILRSKNKFNRSENIRTIILEVESRPTKFKTNLTKICSLFSEKEAKILLKRYKYISYMEKIHLDKLNHIML